MINALREFIKALLPHEHNAKIDTPLGGKQCSICARVMYPKY